MRSVSAVLNTPAYRTDRYHDLTPIEPTTVVLSRPAARRQLESQWAANRALEPELHSLMTHDRQPEHTSTLTDSIASETPHLMESCLSGAFARTRVLEDSFENCGYDLGEQCPFGFET
jgi:hypothetical protein